MMCISHKGTAYELTGPENAPTLVLIHGIGLSRQMWNSHIPTLTEHFRVLSYDLCGHGESLLPEGALDLKALSEQLGGLLDELHIDRCIIIGFSLGGMINRRFAIDHPDRVGALVILNSPHERTPDAQKMVEERAVATHAGGISVTLEATLERWFTSGFREKSPSVVAWVRETLLANDVENFARHRQILASGVNELIRPVPAIAVPTLVMTGENDTGSPPDASRAIATEIADARVVIVPNLKHLGILEEPELFSREILQFLCGLLRRWETTLTGR